MLYEGPFECNSVFFPKPIFVGLGIFIAHVPHKNIHEGSARKEVAGLCRYYCDFMVTKLAYMPSCCYSTYPISYNDNVHNLGFEDYYQDKLIKTSLQVTTASLLLVF